jgi:Flp pilus assembly protein TadD
MVLVGQIHLEAKRPAEARRVLMQAIAIDAASAEVWNELGGVEMTEGNPKRAIEYYLKALNIKSDLTYALLNTAQAYAQLGYNSNAEKFFTRALEADPHSAEAANGLGLTLANENRLDEARRSFERAIEIRRDYASAINNLGVLYINRGDTNNAIAAFRYGIQVAPGEDLLYLNLGRVYVNRGERDKARQVIEEWLERKPGNETALKALRALDAERR